MNNILINTKVGDAIRVNNTVYVKQVDGRWKSPFGIKLESSLLYDIAGKKVDFLAKNEEKDEVPSSYTTCPYDMSENIHKNKRKKFNREKEIELNETKGDNQEFESSEEDKA